MGEGCFKNLFLVPSIQILELTADSFGGFHLIVCWTYIILKFSYSFFSF